MRTHRQVLDRSWMSLGSASGVRWNAHGYVRRMNHRLARTFSVSAALATAGVVGGNAVVSHGTPASASATSSSASTPGSGSTESSAASTNPGSATPTSTVPVTPTPVAGSATQFSLVAGDAATVILDTNGGVLRIVAFAPHPGWFTVRLEQ